MKKILVAAAIVGAIGAALIIYLRDYYAESTEGDEIADAADDAYNTMNKHIGKAERATDFALN